MSTALAKAKQETAALRRSNAQAASKRRQGEKKFVAMAAGAAGAAVGAVGFGAIDAKSEDGDTATFGESSIPVTPAVGLAAALIAAPLAKKFPVASSFIYQSGMAGVAVGIYKKTQESMEEEDGSEA